MKEEKKREKLSMELQTELLTSIYKYMGLIFYFQLYLIPSD